jgi:putative nucleotidyltransferase with HDIG domain
VSETLARDQGLGQEASGPAPTERASKRVLFVGDTPNVLEHLSEVLRRYPRVWRIDVVGSGDAALASLAAEPADVVVADMQMPGMDAATLLTRVLETYPTTGRIILSGQANPRVLAMAAAVAHRFLGKPFNVEELGLLIERSCVLRELTEHAKTYRAAAAATTLPSRPGVYTQIIQVMCDPAWGPAQLAAVIERDIAMTAKVLQLANSAFFGISHEVTRVRDAVVYLGAETIKSLTLTAEAFSKLAPKNLDGFSIEEFQQHAMLVAGIAAAILPDGRERQEAVTAALLHDIGKLVLIADDPRRWVELSEAARRRSLPLHQIEQEQDGVTHAATGAYLLSLWGLPDGVVEAVAHHHDPGSFPGLALHPVAAVHIGDVLAHQLQPSARDNPPPGTLEEAFLDRLGLRSRQDLWRDLAGRWATRLNGSGVDLDAIRD